MSSAWWFLVTFAAGGWCGMLIMALMQLGSDALEEPKTRPGAPLASDPIRFPQSTSSADAGDRVAEVGY
jgi:hypothetical protein